MMTVIETKGTIDENGNLILKHPLRVTNKNVRVVIQVLDNIEEKEPKKKQNTDDKPKSKNKKATEDPDINNYDVSHDEDEDHKIDDNYNL